MTPRDVMRRAMCCGAKAALACHHGDACNIPEVFKDDADAILAALRDAGFAVRSDAEVAAAVLAERAACAGVAVHLIDHGDRQTYQHGGNEAIRRAILARPAPDGADALAAALAQARREGIEAAAVVADALGAKWDADRLTLKANAARWDCEVSADSARQIAAAIRALLPAPDAALLRDFTRWTEGTSDE